MQKVERTKHGERRHGRLAAVLLCALLLAGSVTAAVLLRKQAAEPPEPGRQRVTGALTQRTPEELQSVTIIHRGEDPWTLVRDADGKMRLQEEGGTEAWTVDETIGDAIQDAAVNLTYEDVFTENREDWAGNEADFGLADPLVTAVIRFTDGTGVTARIGESADPDGNAAYYLTADGDDRLYAVSAGTVEDLNIEKPLLRPVAQLEVHSALLDRITVKNGDGSIRTEWSLQGEITDRDAAENWLVTSPFTYPADYEAMKNLRESAADLRLGTWIGSAEEGGAYGLDHPSAVIELHMAAGSTGTVSDNGVYDVSDWEERTLVLTLGNARSEMTDYVRFGEEIFTINHFTVSAFTETHALATAARYAVATPLNSLESAEIETADGKTVRYALIRPDDETAGSGEEAVRENRCLRNGEEISYDAFAAAWERLLTVTVSGELPEHYRVQEAHTKYTFRTVSGGTHTVELSDYDGMHDAVTMDGHTLFYLIKNGMTELP